MVRRSELATRDRAVLLVRLATFGGLAGALGLSWLFSNLAVAYFSGKLPVPMTTPPPDVPMLAAPAQAPPKVVNTVVHHPSNSQPAQGGPRPPGQAPRPAPAAPAPPVCHSTPSKPC